MIVRSLTDQWQTRVGLRCRWIGNLEANKTGTVWYWKARRATEDWRRASQKDCEVTVSVISCFLRFKALKVLLIYSASLNIFLSLISSILCTFVVVFSDTSSHLLDVDLISEIQFGSFHLHTLRQHETRRAASLSCVAVCVLWVWQHLTISLKEPQVKNIFQGS